jgi:hypothetical protein
MSEKKRVVSIDSVGARGKGLTRVVATLHKRDVLVRRLMKALRHLPKERQYAVITSFMSLKELERIVEFQEAQ